LALAAAATAAAAAAAAVKPLTRESKVLLAVLLLL
jgi:hypothetical protein